MFLGGWQAPPGIAAINNGMFNQGWWGLLWFVVKLWTFMFFFVWLRGSLPRVRYDQFMRFGWKFLIPVTLLWVVAVAFIRGAQLAFFGDNTGMASIIMLVVFAAIFLPVAWVWEGRHGAARVTEDHPEEIDPYAGGYPIPPLPGQRLLEPSLKGARSLASAAGSADHAGADQGAADQSEADQSEADLTGAAHPELTDQEDTRG
jgi:NADH-quinone oxidoreductase subunit H